MTGYWKTKDGTVMKVSAMTDSHLRNTINMLKENNFEGFEVDGDFYGEDGVNDEKIEELELELASRQQTPPTEEKGNDK